MRLVIASDHAGRNLKEYVAAMLRQKGHEVEDLGVSDPTPVDYPDYAGRLASVMQQGGAELGILVCGTGTGMCIAANRYRGVRAVAAVNSTQAKLARGHNDANVLCLGERLVGVLLAEDIVDTFLGGSFEGGRHVARVEKIERIDEVPAQAAG